LANEAMLNAGQLLVRRDGGDRIGTLGATAAPARSPGMPMLSSAPDSKRGWHAAEERLACQTLAAAKAARK
jgi:hypothetical protein